MKKIVLSVCTVAAMSSLVFAGGGMKEVTPVVEPVVVIPVVEELSGFYAGLGITAVSIRDSDISVDWGGTTGQDRVGNVSFVAGYNFNEYIAAEGRYTTSFTHDEQVEMSGWSLFVKPQYPVTEDFSVYALLGYGGVNLEGALISNIPVVDVDDSGFQWGIGASYTVMENVSLYADYAWLADDMDNENGAYKLDVDAFTVGVNYLF